MWACFALTDTSGLDRVPLRGMARDMREAPLSRGLGPACRTKPHGSAVMLVTQTCDLQPEKTLKGHALVQLHRWLNPMRGRVPMRFVAPHLVPVPWAGPTLLADLDQTASIDGRVASAS